MNAQATMRARAMARHAHVLLLLKQHLQRREQTLLVSVLERWVLGSGAAVAKQGGGGCGELDGGKVSGEAGGAVAAVAGGWTLPAGLPQVLRVCSRTGLQVCLQRQCEVSKFGFAKKMLVYILLCVCVCC